MKKPEIKIVNKSSHDLPKYSTEQAAGMDIRANIRKSFVLRPLERVIVPTELYIQLPVGYEAQIRPRSGAAAKEGLTVLNSPGTIDSDYRGEIKIILVNLSNADVLVNDGDRIAQMVIAEHAQGVLIPVEELNDTERGAGGLGHTGKN